MSAPPTRAVTLARRHFAITALIAVVVVIAEFVQPSYNWWLFATGGLTTAVVIPYLAGLVAKVRSSALQIHSVVSLALIGLGALAALVWSWAVVFEVVPTFLGQPQDFATYFGAAALAIPAAIVTRSLEVAAYRDESQTLSTLRGQMPHSATVRRRREDVPVDVAELTGEETVVVCPGERIPCDGVVIGGRGEVDCRTLHGTAELLRIREGDRVHAGTWLEQAGDDDEVDPTVLIRPTVWGDDTLIAEAVRRLRRSSVPQRPTGRLRSGRLLAIGAVFAPSVAVLAAAAAAAWAGLGFADHAIRALLSVLLIAAPCAIGAWTPLAVTRSARSGARSGIFFQGPDVLVNNSQVTDVCMTVTGVLTTGRLAVVDITADPDWSGDETEALRFAASMEDAIDHPIARAITNAATQRKITSPLAESVVAHAGLGLRGNITGTRSRLGTPRWFTEFEHSDAMIAAENEASLSGNTAVLLGIDQRVVAVITLADELRPSAKPAMKRLSKLGYRSALLGAGTSRSLEVMAKKVGADSSVGQLTASERAEWIGDAQTPDEENERARPPAYAAVGELTHDAAMLATSRVGISVGETVPGEREGAAVMLPHNNLGAVPVALLLMAATAKIVRRNTLWTFLYNAVALAIACTGFLPPQVAPIAMALSAIYAVRNSTKLPQT